MLKIFFYKFPNNLLRCFQGINFFLHLLAIILTYILVTSGFDWRYFESTRDPRFLSFGLPAALIGFFVPTLLLAYIYFIGEIRKSFKLKNTAATLVQAAFTGWLISACYKTFTGRLHPEVITQISSVDISRIFNFGLFRDGIFWGWPSSHTTVAFAMASALIAFYPRRKRIAIAALTYSLYIGLGVSVTIHWFFDFVAGAIIGIMVGLTIGKSYLDRLADHREN